MLHQFIEQQLKNAVAKISPDADPDAVMVRPCPDPKFGDYQTSSLIPLAKQRKVNPRQFAEQAIALLEVSPWCETAEVAGAGFVNFRLRLEAISPVLQSAFQGEHLFFQKKPRLKTIVLDFSSPNVAKPMHVGHIRSTILGDCLARTFRLLGHRVITDNHLGDWGTQFGKLLLGWKDHLDPQALQSDPLGEMERLYKIIHRQCETDPAALDRARQELVKLQSGERQNLGLWRRMIELSLEEFDRIYQRLGVQFDLTLGESFYNPRLQSVVQELRDRGLARESEGAVVVFFEDDPELKAHPALIQKSDGAFNYATSDLATLEYRCQTWKPDQIIYVTDSRQQLHFKQVFAIFRRWHPQAKIQLAHIWFGTILGEDGRPFKTRTGETIRLKDLLDEAEERAFQIVSEKNPALSQEQKKEIARIVGLGAIKYADLMPNRQSDYVFSWDKMLGFTGNTAPYLLYAYTRIRSIFRKLPQPEALGSDQTPEFDLSAAEEITLAKQLLNFGLILDAVGQEYRPNFLCNYLYDLAGHFARFYENCPVLKAPEKLRATRLGLCELTSRVLKQGLDVLGIETSDQM